MSRFIQAFPERIKANGLGEVSEAIDVLRRYGFIEFMRCKADARPVHPHSTYHVPEQAMIEYGRTLGYQEAIEDMLYFKEQYLLPTENKAASNPSLDFGARRRAMSKEDLTQEDLDFLNKHNLNKES